MAKVAQRPIRVQKVHRGRCCDPCLLLAEKRRHIDGATACSAGTCMRVQTLGVIAPCLEKDSISSQSTLCFRVHTFAPPRLVKLARKN